MVLPGPPDAGSLGTAVTFAQYIHVKRNNRARMMSELHATQQAIWDRSVHASQKLSSSRHFFAVTAISWLMEMLHSLHPSGNDGKEERDGVRIEVPASRCDLLTGSFW